MENRNGRGIFLGVVSVATLIVAIIGATFAYFSASVSTNEGAIAGNTLDVSSSAITITATKLSTSDLGGSLTGALQDLVPAVITEDQAGYAAAVSAHCEDSTAHYTGCHVYEIDVNATNYVPSATMLASLTRSGAGTVDTNWSYALLQTANVSTKATSGTAPTLTVLKEGKDAAQTPAAATVHRFANGATQELVTESLNAGHTYYYLIVYLKNINASQNGAGDVPSGSSDTATNETSSYAGTITLKAAGGQVKATFSAS